MSKVTAPHPNNWLDSSDLDMCILHVHHTRSHHPDLVSERSGGSAAGFNATCHIENDVRLQQRRIIKRLCREGHDRSAVLQPASVKVLHANDSKDVTGMCSCSQGSR